MSSSDLDLAGGRWRQCLDSSSDSDEDNSSCAEDVDHITTKYNIPATSLDTEFNNLTITTANDKHEDKDGTDEMCERGAIRNKLQAHSNKPYYQSLQSGPTYTPHVSPHTHIRHMSGGSYTVLQDSPPLGSPASDSAPSPYTPLSPPYSPPQLPTTITSRVPEFSVTFDLSADGLGRSMLAEVHHMIMKEECEQYYADILKVPANVFYNQDDDGDTELMKVVFLDDWNLLYAMMGRIVRDGKREYINLRNKKSQSVLYAAVAHKNLLLVKWLVEDLSADIWACCNGRGDTLMHALARWGDEYIDITDYLLQSTRDIDATNIHGETALCLAVMSKKSSSRTIRNLCRQGASTYHQWTTLAGNLPMTPVHYAVLHYEENPELIHLLLDSTHSSSTAVNAPLSPHDSSTLLHTAVYYIQTPHHKLQLISYLISKGADPTLRDHLELQPYQWCDPGTHADICKLLKTE